VLGQVTRDGTHLAFVLAYSPLGTSATTLAESLPFGLAFAGAVLSKNPAHFAEVYFRIVFASRRLESLLGLKSGEPSGDLFEGREMRS
jgi:hypothetical protein